MPTKSSTQSSTKKTKSENKKDRGLKLVRTLKGHRDWIGRVAWSPDGSILASVCDDETIRLWETETGECVRILQWPSGGESGIAFHPNGKTLAVAGERRVRIFETATGNVLKEITTSEFGIGSLAYDPTGNVIAFGSRLSVYLWDVDRDTHVSKLGRHDQTFLSVAFDPTGQILAAGTHGSIEEWEKNNGWGYRIGKVHTRTVYSIAFDPLSQFLANGSGRVIQMWDVKSGRLVRELEAHTNVIDCIAFSPVLPILASKSNDGTFRLWDSDSGKELVSVVSPKSDGSQFPGLAFHPSRPLLAVAAKTEQNSDTHVINIWEFDLNILLNQPVVQTNHYVNAKVVLLGDTGVGKSGHFNPKKSK